jgi:23S rRNA U2552 (ribose-2'-O)-methylase RlmE/FtsJ
MHYKKETQQKSSRRKKRFKRKVMQMRDVANHLFKNKQRVMDACYPESPG